MKLITLVIPAYNEEKSLPFLFKRLDNLVSNNKGYRFEFLFVNDGSKDNTLDILQQESKSNPLISYLNFSRNFGKEIAVAAGLDHASGDAVVIMDADGQEPPELIPKMIRWWEEGYDDVYAKRSKRHEGVFKQTTSKLYYRTLQKMTRIPIQIDTGDFRLFSKRCVLALRQFKEASRQNKALFSWIGYRKKELEYEQGERSAGTTKWKFGPLSPGNSLVNLAIDGFTSFTTMPIRFVSMFGVLVSFAAFIYIIVIIIQTLFSGSHISGYPSMMAVTLFLGGVQLISLGVIGEYVGRIFTETKGRPLYLIEHFHQAKIAETKNNVDEKRKLNQQ